jgi:glycosyltransferase involved in cell wall biosynthesis
VPDLSVVVPLHDERDNVVPLVDMVREALRVGPSWELILVDDGSRDGTADVVQAAAREDGRVRLVELAHQHGQAAAMQAGFDHARGATVVTMDGDLQNDAADVPAMLAKLGEGYDLVVGYRRDRRDHLLSRRIPSWVANRLLAWSTGVAIRDSGCSLKAYRREVLERVRLYADLHRFIPALAVAMANARIAEVPVRHHARARGRSKYGLSRVGPVLVDLLTIKLIRSFRRSPLVYFGLAALLPLGLSAVVMTAALLLDAGGLVLVGVSLTLASLGVYLVMLGVTAEVVVPDRFMATSAARPLVREIPPSSPGRR